MQLQQFFHGVEDAAHHVGLGIASQLFHVLVRDKVDIEFRANPLQGLGQRQGRLAGVLWFHRRNQRAQNRRIVPRLQDKSLVDDDGRDIRIEHGGAERVFKTADKDRLIDEAIDRAAQLAPFGGKIGPIRGGDACDDQGFEVRPPHAGLAKSGRQQVRHVSVVIRLRVPIAGMLAERSRLQRLRDAHRQREGRRRIVRDRALLSGPPSGGEPG